MKDNDHLTLSIRNKDLSVLNKSFDGNDKIDATCCNNHVNNVNKYQKKSLQNDQKLMIARKSSSKDNILKVATTN